MARQVARYVPRPPTEVAAARTRRARRQVTRLLVVVLAVVSLVAVPLLRADAVTHPRTLHAEAAVGAAPFTPGSPIDGTALTDHIGATGAAAHSYRVCERTAPGVCSPMVRVTY